MDKTNGKAKEVVIRGDKPRSRMLRWLMSATCHPSEGRPSLEAIHVDSSDGTLVTADGFVLHIVKPNPMYDNPLPAGTWVPEVPFDGKRFVNVIEQTDMKFPDYSVVIPSQNAARDPGVRVTEVALSPRLLMRALKDIDAKCVVLRVYQRADNSGPSTMPIELVAETGHDERLVVLMPMHMARDYRTRFPLAQPEPAPVEQPIDNPEDVTRQRRAEAACG